jgi:hypothetical protein
MYKRAFGEETKGMLPFVYISATVKVKTKNEMERIGLTSFEVHLDRAIRRATMIGEAAHITATTKLSKKPHKGMSSPLAKLIYCIHYFCSRQ